MNRLSPPPSHLAPRVLVLCLVFALALLAAGGGSLSEALALLCGTLPVLPDGTTALHAVLPRALWSFCLILLALITSLNLALACALLASRLGGRFLRCLGWAGRALGGVPPMGWAMGALVLFIRGWDVPVETLFPHHTPPELDSWMMRTGRLIWTWLAPVLVLGLPLFGFALFSLSHRLSALLDSNSSLTLKARGLGPGSIVHRHFAPLLGVQLARLARPAAAMLLFFDIPVEEIFGFDGWGHFVAVRLSVAVPHTNALAAAIWAGGWMLTGLLFVASIPDRRGLPPSLEEINDHGQKWSLLSVIGGAVLVAALILMPAPGDTTSLWSELMESHDAWLHDVPRAGATALIALVLVILGVPLLLPSLRSRWLADGGLIASLGCAPWFVMALLWEHEHARSWLTAGVALAVPGLVALRSVFLEGAQSDFVEASRSLGQSTFGLYQRHLLRQALPGLLNWATRTAGSTLILFSVLDFYDAAWHAGTSGTWGALMRAHEEDLLEHPARTLGPALWLALWCLSFRLLSRAFRTDAPPQNRTSTFVP